jgi:hypothetical protein
VPGENEEKAVKAFELIEIFEKKGKAERKPLRPVKNSHCEPAAVKNENSGIHIHFSMDALVSDSDKLENGEKAPNPGKSKLFDVSFTIPYVWRVPVIGKTLLKTIRRFQAFRRD